jgi:hypothetical protein
MSGFVILRRVLSGCDRPLFDGNRGFRWCHELNCPLPTDATFLTQIFFSFPRRVFVFSGDCFRGNPCDFLRAGTISRGIAGVVPFSGEGPLDLCVAIFARVHDRSVIFAPNVFLIAWILHSSSTNTNDTATGSLRQAILDANSMGGRTIKVLAYRSAL